MEAGGGISTPSITSSDPLNRCLIMWDNRDPNEPNIELLWESNHTGSIMYFSE